MVYHQPQVGCWEIFWRDAGLHWMLGTKQNLGMLVSQLLHYKHDWNGWNYKHQRQN